MNAFLDTQDVTFETDIQGIQPKRTIEPCTIILVEDDIDDQIFAKKSLESSEYVKETKMLSDGQALLSYLDEQGYYDRSVMNWNPVLIVLDLNMPRVDGFDVLKEIKADPFISNIPVVVLSSIETRHKVLEAFTLGADGYMTKPLDLSKLEDFLELSWQWPPKEMY